MKRRGKPHNAVLILLALSPVGALGLILGGPFLRPRPAMAGSYNGTPFQMAIKTTRLGAMEAVLSAEKKFLARRGKPRPDFRPWEALQAHPYLRDAMAALVPGRLVEYPDGSMSAAFAMPRAQSEGGGCILGTLEAEGPLRAVLETTPGGPLLEIRYGPILVRQYAAQDRENLVEGLRTQGWEAMGGNQPWMAFRREGWNAVVSREGAEKWTFFAFTEEGS